MNICGDTLPVVVCLEGMAVKGWFADNVQDLTTLHFSASPQIDLGLLNLVNHHWAGQQCKGKPRSQGAKCYSSSLLCKQTTHPSLASLFSQVPFTL